MTTIQNLKSNSLLQTAAINVVCVAVACMVPAFSHVAAVPIYKCNPMLLILLAAMFLTTRCRASQQGLYLSAVAMPVVSSLLVGMPSLGIAVCIAIELCTFVAIIQFAGLRCGFVANLSITLVAMLVGKVVYYLLKWLLLAPEVLVSTQWQTQIVVLFGYATLFASALYIASCRNNGK